jgi:hypothetical protein
MTIHLYIDTYIYTYIYVLKEDYRIHFFNIILKKYNLNNVKV